MTHPDELLAGYVDDTLGEPERGAVDQHLIVCSTCREDVELASRARAQLRALPEEPVPLGVTGPVLREALEEAPTGRRRVELGPRLYRLAGLAAAAAAVVLVVTVALPNLGPERADEEAAGLQAERAPEAAGGAAEMLAPPPFERIDRDFAPADLQGLSQETATGVGGEVAAPAPTADARDAEQALACVERGAQTGPNDRLVRLIQARFQGTPAYLAVYLQGPGAGQAPTKVVIWVVAQGECTPLSFSQQRL